MNGNKQRAIDRNRAIWKKFNTLKNMGIESPVEESILDGISRDLSSGLIVITEDEIERKKAERDTFNELAYDEIRLDRELVDKKYKLAVNKIALRLATERYIQAVRSYAVEVDELIFKARQYANEIDKEQIGIENKKTEIAIEKAKIEIDALDEKKRQELLNNKMLKVDIAKLALDIAKTILKGKYLNIEIAEIDAKKIRKEIEEKMTEIEKAEIQLSTVQLKVRALMEKLTVTRLDITDDLNVLRRDYNRWLEQKFYPDIKNIEMKLLRRDIKEEGVKRRTKIPESDVFDRKEMTIQEKIPLEENLARFKYEIDKIYKDYIKEFKILDKIKNTKEVELINTDTDYDKRLDKARAKQSIIMTRAATITARISIDENVSSSDTLSHVIKKEE